MNTQTQFYTENYIFPHKIWLKIFNHFKNKKYISYLEIGVYEGRSLTWIAQNILPKQSHIHALDKFQHHGLPERFSKNIEPLKQQFQIQVLSGWSEKVLPQLEKQNYDLIYVDADHIYVQVWNDIILAWPLLKTGGYIVLDDYIWSKFLVPNSDRPEIAINDFLNLASNSYRMIYKDVQIFIQKTAELPDSLKVISADSEQIPKNGICFPAKIANFFLTSLYFLYAVKRFVWLRVPFKK